MAVHRERLENAILKLQRHSDLHLLGRHGAEKDDTGPALKLKILMDQLMKSVSGLLASHGRHLRRHIGLNSN